MVFRRLKREPDSWIQERYEYGKNKPNKDKNNLDYDSDITYVKIEYVIYCPMRNDWFDMGLCYGCKCHTNVTGNNVHCSWVRDKEKMRENNEPW